jgi:hypothetical protein
MASRRYHACLPQVGDWVAGRKDIEHVNAAWLLLPVGNFVAALVGPALDSSYAPAMQFWFAFALMTWALLFALTFAKAVVMTDNGGGQPTCLPGCVAQLLRPPPPPPPRATPLSS